MLPLRVFGAGNEIRTRDPDLGKVVLYQLSYSRVGRLLYAHSFQSQVVIPVLLKLARLPSGKQSSNKASKPPR
jgi:hypothetical protein